MKRIVMASAFALLSIGPAAAQSSVIDPQLATTASAKVAAVETCEAELRRLADLNKTLAANYDPQHVYDVCKDEQ